MFISGTNIGVHLYIGLGCVLVIGWQLKEGSRVLGIKDGKEMSG